MKISEMDAALAKYGAYPEDVAQVRSLNRNPKRWDSR